MLDNRSRTTTYHTVAVLAPDGLPLNPTHPAKARILLKKGKAKVERSYPIFTIRLTYWPKPKTDLEVQRTTLQIDDGEVAGFAVVQHNPTHERVVCAGEIITTGREVSDQLANRGRLRHYRKRPGRGKRGEQGSPKPEQERGEGWYPPSIKLDVHQKVRVARLLCHLFPIQRIIIETVSVDIRKLLEPEVSGSEYQKPRTIRAQVRWTFPEECAVCGVKLTDLPVGRQGRTPSPTTSSDASCAGHETSPMRFPSAGTATARQATRSYAWMGASTGTRGPACVPRTGRPSVVCSMVRRSC